MSLAPVQLDDLTWSGMVAGARRRIAAVSGGQWTLHAAVDPGVTLLELYAWLLEQRVFWMDQIPDSLVCAVLALLGESPRPGQPAITVLSFPGAAHPYRSVPSGTELRRRETRFAGPAPLPVFTLEHSVTLFPVEHIEVVLPAKAAEGETRAVVWRRELPGAKARGLERPVELFPADSMPAEATVVLWLSRPVSAPGPAPPFSLLFEMEVPPNIPPQWMPEAPGNLPPPAKVTWAYPTTSGRAADFSAGQVEDGTGGLRRSGIVRLSVPADWQAGVPDPETNFIPYPLRIRVDRATFSAPPRLLRLVPNAVVARHQRRQRWRGIRSNWLPLPGLVLSIPEILGEPASQTAPLENTVRLRIRERDGRWHKWIPAQSFSFHGPGDRVFVVDRARAELRFGDGLTGRIPVPDSTASPNIALRFHAGGGVAGNLGSNLQWEGLHHADLTAENVVPAEWGQETEPLASPRARATAATRQRNRAVTESDYIEIAVTTPGVGLRRAHAAVGHHPHLPCAVVPGAVTVFVVPHAPRESADEERTESPWVVAPQPDPGALTAARARFDGARLVGSEVFVCGPRYRPVSLTLDVAAEPVDPLALRRRIAQRLQRFLDPLVGGDDGQGWTFGEPLRPSVLLREAQRALGPEGQATRVAIHVEGMNREEDCADVAIGAHELASLQRVTVRLQQATSSAGGGLR